MNDLPIDWINTTVGRSASVLTGFPFASARFSESGIRLVRGSNVKRGMLDWAPAIAKCWPTYEASLRSFQLDDGDLVIAMDGALVGRSYARISRSDLPAYLVQRVARLRGHSINQRLLYHWISSDRFAQHVDSVKTHSAIPHISPRDIRDFHICIPANLREQQRISDALSAADGLITTLEQLIAKKQAIKQGMVQQLLTGKTRLPGFGDLWRTVRLGDLLKRSPRYGINAPAIPNSVDAYTYIRITDIDEGGRFSPHPKVSVRHRNSADYLLREGELVFARTGASVGKSYLYDPNDGVLVYAGFLINVAPDPGFLDPAYLALVSQTAEYWDWVARTSVRSGQPGINGREYAQFQLTLPEIREQRAIASTVNDAIREIRVFGERLVKAKAVKQSMLQQLLTGRTRLSIAEGAA